MLGKLFKHDFASIGRVTFPIFIALTIASLIGKFFIFLASKKSFVDSASTGFYKILKNLSSVFEVLYILAIIVAVAGIFIFIIYRFYQSIYTDEGYLTLTLPVKSHQILFSKLLSAFVWSVLTYAIAFLDLFIILRTKDTVNTFSKIKDAFADIFSDISAGMNISNGTLITELVILAIITIFAQYLIFYTSITAGCSFATKHKLLGTIVAFIVISIIMQILTKGQVHFLNNFLTEKISDLSTDQFKATQATIITVTVTNFIYSLIFFFTSSHFIKSKVNLD